MTKQREIITYDKLREKLEKYITDPEELKTITRAYMFAYEKHFGQKRLTGEDYICHPLSVAEILSSISADYQAISAALMHDVIEDCDVKASDIEEKFGPEIALLVEGVTKINKLSFKGNTEQMAANHRKILVGLSEDVRVIIIKLADRLHNMRTLWIKPEKIQKAKAKETLDIYIPIAHRLGINKIKSELEDLCLRYYKPKVYFEIVEQFNQSKAERDKSLNDMTIALSNLLTDHGVKFDIKGRVKSIYSIYNKLNKGRRWNDIYDMLALRIFVHTEEECYKVLGIIHSKYKPIEKRFKDYIAMPKSNMYQSLHTTVFGNDGDIFEIQIRTYDMDKIAEYGIASHWSYKESKGSNIKADMQNDMEQKLQFFRTIMELKATEKTDKDFVESVKADVFKNTIYVFTPKGDVIELPNGSTPIDFAYRVHSSVGNQMVGAIVNNNIVPLNYKLKDGDFVKINTNKQSPGPSREWINIAYTVSARNKVKGFFNKIDKEEYIKKGELYLKEELKKKDISFNKFLASDEYNHIKDERKFNDINELYLELGTNKITIKQILNVNDSEEDTFVVPKKIISSKISSQNKDIIVEGIDNIKITMAPCCMPVYGDKIIGYIQNGKGITIHRLACPNLNELEERFVSVSWADTRTQKCNTKIIIYTNTKKSILLSIVSKVANTEIVIQRVDCANSKNGSTINITLSVPSKEELKNFISDIKTIPEVVDVERSIQ